MSTQEKLPPEQYNDSVATRRTILRREYVLDRLHEADGPVTERELATGFVARSNFDRSETTSVQVSLRHRDLPALEADGLVSWDRAEKTVTPSTSETDDVSDGTDAGIDQRDADGGRGIEERRHRIVAVLEPEDEPVDATALAREIATDGDEEPSSDAVESELVQLHHVDLPKLDDDGLLDYDPVDRTILP